MQVRSGRAMRPFRAIVALLATVAMLGLAAPAANAALVNVSGGSSALTPNFNTIVALSEDNIYTRPIPPAELTSIFTLKFPITGGLVEDSTMLGTVNHSGGILITKYSSTTGLPEKELPTTDLKILNGNSLVGNALGLIPTPTADLVNPQHTVSGGEIAYEADVNINLVTATVLNVYFGTDAFSGGMNLGHIRSTIQTKPLL